MLHCSVREAQRRIDSREFAEWMAEFRLSPWGEQRAELALGQLTAIVANCMAAKGAELQSPDEFVLKYDEPEEEAEPDEEEKQAVAARVWSKLVAAVKTVTRAKR